MKPVVMEKVDVDLFVDDMLCRVGMSFAHTDEDDKRRVSIEETFKMVLAWKADGSDISAVVNALGDLRKPCIMESYGIYKVYVKVYPSLHFRARIGTI